MSKYIEDATKAIVQGDQVAFMQNLKSAMFEELGNNEEYQELAEELEKYSAITETEGE